MKYTGLKLVTMLAITLITSSAFADKVIIYNGSRGYANDYRNYQDRRAYYKDHRNRARRGKYCRFKDYRRPRRYRQNPGYRYHGRPQYRPYSNRYDRNRFNRPDYRLYASAIAGSIIDRVLGAGLGNALIETSVGRDTAYRNSYRY